MSKAIVNQRQIYKCSSTRYKDNDWDLKLDRENAKKNKEIVSISDSIALRMIRKITNKNISEEEINEIKKEIKKIKNKPKTKDNLLKIKNLYEKLENKIMVNEICSILFDSMGDWNRANKSSSPIKLNNKEMVRCIGTTGGVKKNTVLFVEKRIHNELNKMIDNGRNKDKKYIPAKLEAYKALAFSGSTPVTQPNKVLVIKDGEHDIYEDVLLLSDDKKGGFNLTKEKKYKIHREFTDGCGMISERLSKQWSIDLGCYKYINGEKKEEYTPTGFNIRNAFCKGMVFTFPFLEFAEEVAHNYMVEDAWGNLIDIREVDLIITTNMLKLWDAYDSIDHYMKCCKENYYEFCVAKILPKELEKTRNMNYQFLQSYEMSDDEIKQLVNQTLDNIKGALSENYLKSILFLKGCYLTIEDFLKEEYNYLKALMIDKRMKNDPFIRNKIYKMIKKKIKDSKKGVVEVKGCYEIVSGDLYALCQYMFGMKVTGLLQKNEFYSHTWLNKGVNKIVAYRAPMTVHNNIKVMPLIKNKRTEKWYRFMKTCIIVNAWDCTMDTMNGEDFD